MLASLLGTVAAGREADRVGPARPYLAGLVLFAAGLAVAGLAPSMAVLVVGRCLQGLGAGAVPAIAYVAIGRSMPDSLRPRMMAMLSTAWVIPGLIGPVVSAEVARAAGWRVVFLGLIPLVALAGTLALPALLRLGPPSRSPLEADADEHRLRDALRAALGGALVLQALATNQALLGIALALAGVAIGFPALRRLLPAGTLVARGGLPATILSRGLLTFAFFGADAYVTLAMTTALHHSTRTASVLITFPTLTWTLGSWVQARLSRRHENRALVRAGFALLLAGIAGMAIAMRPGVALAVPFIAWSAAGLAMGLAYAPTSLLMLQEASSDRTGWASASLNLSDVLGTALGTGLGGAALVIAANQGSSISTGITVAFALAGLGGVAGLAVSGRLPVRRIGRTLAGEPATEPATVP